MPAFLTMRLSGLSFDSGLRGFQGAINRASRNCSQVGKVGMPPLGSSKELNRFSWPLPGSMHGAGVFLFAGFDAKGKPVLLRRQGTGGVVGEGTGRAVGLVEVNHNLPGLIRW